MNAVKRIIALTLVFFSAKFCLCQQSFSTCYDTLSRHLAHDSVFNESPFTIWENCVKGKLFPPLSLQTITGKKIETEKLKGKVIVINLWFTSCEPCIEEMPALNRLVQEYKNKNVVFLGITKDTKEILDQYFFPKFKFDFEIIPHSMSVIKTIGNTGFPTTYFIDSKGIVRDVWAIGSNEQDIINDAYLKGKPIIDKLLKVK